MFHIAHRVEAQLIYFLWAVWLPFNLSKQQIKRVRLWKLRLSHCKLVRWNYLWGLEAVYLVGVVAVHGNLTTRRLGNLMKQVGNCGTPIRVIKRPWRVMTPGRSSNRQTQPHPNMHNYTLWNSSIRLQYTKLYKDTKCSLNKPEVATDNHWGWSPYSSSCKHRKAGDKAKPGQLNPSCTLPPQSNLWSKVATSMMPCHLRSRGKAWSQKGEERTACSAYQLWYRPP